MNTLWHYLERKRIGQFGLVSVMGFVLNLLITTGSTEFIFGRENYFIGYIIGIVVNIIHNFLFHIHFTFKVKDKLSKRFVQYVILITVLSISNYFLVRLGTLLFGVDWYIVIIILVTGTLFLMNYLISHSIIFRRHQ